MGSFRKFVDDWCYENADCNAVAFLSKGGMVDSGLVGQLIDAIGKYYGSVVEMDDPKVIDSSNVRIMPKCALCDLQAWGWSRCGFEEPYMEVALCKNHAPNGAASYTLGSINAVRLKLENHQHVNIQFGERIEL